MANRPNQFAGLDPERDPWARQPGESDIAYRRFVQYLHMDTPRPSYVDFAREIKAKTQVVNSTAAKYNWRARLEAYDSRLTEDVRAEVVAHVAGDATALADRQTALASKIHQLASGELDKMILQSQLSDEPVVTPKTLIALVQMSLVLDRMLVGGDAADASARGEGMPDLGRLSTDELGELRALATKTLGTGEK